jgi:hypothetical protein
MMSNSMSSLHDVSNVWTVLEASSAGSHELTVAPMGRSVQAGEILGGVDALGNHHLLIPLLAGEPFVGDTSGKVVHLVRIGKKGKSYLSAVCLSRDLDDIFAQFARELMDTTAESSSPAEATKEALTKWKSLFSEDAQGGLTGEEQLGLLGELTFLRRLLMTVKDRSTVPWKGPDKSQHDFRWETQAVEVKASRSREGRRIPISSLEQLNPPPNTPLYLAYFRMEDDPGASSLAELVAEIEGLCADRTAFRSQLLRWGYRSSQKSEYDRLRCRVTELSIYNVEGEFFPRVIPQSFVGGKAPLGTEQISYVIDISNEPPHPLPPTVVLRIFAVGDQS